MREVLVFEVDALELCRLDVSLKDVPGYVANRLRAAVADTFLARGELLGADTRYLKYKSVVKALREHEFVVIKRKVHVAAASFSLLDPNVCLLRVIIGGIYRHHFMDVVRHFEEQVSNCFTGCKLPFSLLLTATFL